ncbi:hypothetical protein G3A39_39590 [Paraburkholderia aspalathi]|nr:hypothetical protein [Paraburkholderia aspalathi]
MALNTTPGAENADSYVDVDYFRAYCERIGHDIDDKDATQIEQALRRGTAWIDATYGLRFIGEPTDIEQALEWPRKNAVWRGSTLPDGIIPRQVKNAACESAWRELTAPGSLSPDYDGSEQIKRTRKKVGDLEKEVEYADSASTKDAAVPVFAVIDGILSGLMVPAPGSTVVGFLARA